MLVVYHTNIIMKVLFVAPNKSSFITQDYENLKTSFNTHLFICWTPSQILKTLNAVFEHDICFFWFASLRFLPVFALAKILKKKTIIVAGGYDVSSMPEVKYGGIKPKSFSSFLRKKFLQKSDKIITVSKSNSREAIENASIPDWKISKIYLGFEKPNIILKPFNERKNQVVFIASCNESTYKLKGFDTFLNIARLMPEISFVHVGVISHSHFKQQLKSLQNVTSTGYLENMGIKFSNILNESKIILLPSLKESFGASLIEGCLHGCRPVGSNSYALPEIIGEMGVLCEIGNINDFQRGINSIIANSFNPETIQRYYYKRFSKHIRRSALKTILHELYQKSVFHQ